MKKYAGIVCVLVVSLVLLKVSISGVDEQAQSMRQLEAKSIKQGTTLFTLIARSIGAKKAATSILWVKQTLNIGGLTQGEVTPAQEIYKTSREMSYLNPYFVGNYYFSGTVLGMVDEYKAFNLASEIFQTGIEYLPGDNYIRNYFSGVLAYSQGDDASVLRNFETIILKNRDPILINTIAYIYEKKFKQTGSKVDIKKAIDYWYINSDSDNTYYKKRAIEKLQQYLAYKA